MEDRTFHHKNKRSYHLSLKLISNFKKKNEFVVNCHRYVSLENFEEKERGDSIKLGKIVKREGKKVQEKK